MNLQDFMENHYLSKYRSDRNNQAQRKKILLKDIVLTNLYQKVNLQADIKATMNANSVEFMDADKRRSFYNFHSRNILVGEPVDGKYPLLAGLISYYTLLKVNDDKKRRFDKKNAYNGGTMTWKEPFVVVTVVPFTGREELIDHCKKTYDLNVNSSIFYFAKLDTDDYNEESVIEYTIRMSEDKAFRPVIKAIMLDGKLFPVQSSYEYLLAYERIEEKMVPVSIDKETVL